MRTLNDASLGLFDFTTLQTAGGDSDAVVAWDDGRIRHLCVNVISGAMSAETTFDLVINGTTHAAVFTLPVTPCGTVVVLEPPMSKRLDVFAGDRIVVLSGGESSTAVCARAELVIER